MIIISDLETALDAVIRYFGPNNIEEVTKIEKSALIETKRGQHYYFKFDSKHWSNAGYETGKFKGAGFAINADIFNTIDERYSADILYCNSPNIVYEYNLENFKRNSHKHTQRFNGEQVYVISLYDANQVFYI
jgi:hypothetical protein